MCIFGTPNARIGEVNWGRRVSHFPKKQFKGDYIARATQLSDHSPENALPYSRQHFVAFCESVLKLE